MIKTIQTPQSPVVLDARYKQLRYNLEYIANNLPRETALYPMMTRVVCQDFETLVAGVIEDHGLSNDNGNNND